MAKCDFQKKQLQKALDNLDDAQDAVKGLTGEELHAAAVGVKKALQDVSSAKEALLKCQGIFTPGQSPARFCVWSGLEGSLGSRGGHL